MLSPGTTLALYMGVRAAPRLVADLIARGAPATLGAEVVANATTPRQTTLATTLSALPAALQTARIEGTALILLRWPKTGAAAVPSPGPAIGAGAECRDAAVAVG
jgi:uroporphyrin-III C-methyltransferase/precorrin-2 dehydrogenase/sirohydrochlorin ferrochelatase